jgi:hypothetical protein
VIPIIQEDYHQLLKPEKDQQIYEKMLYSKTLFTQMCAYIQSTKESLFLSPRPLRDIETWDSQSSVVSCLWLHVS